MAKNDVTDETPVVEETPVEEVVETPAEEVVEPAEVEESTEEVQEEVVEKAVAEGEEAPAEPPLQEVAEPITESYLGEPLDPTAKEEVGGDILPVPVSDQERGFTRPFRVAVRHIPSGRVCTLGSGIASELATDPASHETLEFPDISHEPIPVNEFIWEADGTRVGS